MAGGAETLSLASAMIGAAAIWAAYGGVVRGWLSTGHIAYPALSITGTVLVAIGLGTSVGFGPTTALAAGVAVAFIATIRITGR